MTSPIFRGQVSRGAGTTITALPAGANHGALAAFTPASGATIVAVITYDTMSGGSVGVADAVNGTYGAVLLNVLDTGDQQEMAVFAFVGAAASSITPTATWSVAGGFRGLAVWEYPGPITTPIQVVGQLQTAPTTGANAITSGTLTPASQPGCLLGVSMDANTGTNAATVGTGFTSDGAGWDLDLGGNSTSFSHIAIASLTPVAATFTGTNVPHITIAIYLRDAGGGVSHTLVAGQGAFTLTGNAAVFTRARKLVAAQAAFALAGNAAGLVKGRTIAAGQGTFTLAGQAAAFTRARALAAGLGVFALTGNGAIFTRARKLVAGLGTFTLSGNAAGLSRGRTLAAGAGAFVLTGNAAAFTRARALAAGLGAFVLTGNAAALTPGHAGSHTLTAGTGVFALTGNAAVFTRARKLVAAPGAFATTGNAAVFTRGHSLVAGAGVFALSGNGVLFVRHRVLLAAPGIFVFVGNAAVLTAVHGGTHPTLGDVAISGSGLLFLPLDGSSALVVPLAGAGALHVAIKGAR